MPVNRRLHGGEGAFPDDDFGQASFHVEAFILKSVQIRSLRLRCQREHSVNYVNERCFVCDVKCLCLIDE